MLPLGTKAPFFQLPDTDGVIVSLDDFKEAKALLVIFMCNHCPYVKHIKEGLVPLIKEYQERGVAVVGINSNDADSYPEDSFENMGRETRDFSYTFPYLFDETQEVAKSYRAACTPDFFLFDGEHKLVYRGQLDGSRPGNGVPVTGEDLGRAVNAVLEEMPVPEEQRASLGCNIKWKEGNEPDYF
jgi:peroxiredoxin